MSTNFEPMSEDALTTWASGNPCAPTNLAQTALHHLARAKAAEEARDLAIAERDEAYRQRDELGREGDTAHALLNGSIGSRVVPRKGETALVSQARTAAEVVADLRLQLRAIDDAQTILGARPDEMLSDAARRVKAEADDVQRFRGWLNDTALTIGEAYYGNIPARVAALVAAAEAEPAQTFHPPIAVRISRTPGRNGWLRADVDVDDITDPAFLALTGEQYARLALVVTRG